MHGKKTGGYIKNTGKKEIQMLIVKIQLTVICHWVVTLGEGFCLFFSCIFPRMAFKIENFQSLTEYSLISQHWAMLETWRRTRVSVHRRKLTRREQGSGEGGEATPGTEASPSAWPLRRSRHTSAEGTYSRS